MKISFWISAIVFYVVNVAFSNSVQVGTVLFTTTDLVKRCWTDRDKSLLKARLIMQDVLPDPDCIDFSKPEAGVILLDYFHACYQIIATSTYGKIQNLMYLALSDTIGGYLRAYVLPFTRRAYYAGQIRYSEAKKLFQLYDDIRIFLKTNGLGWAAPPDVCYKKIRVKPLTITGGSLEACNQLYTIETETKLHCINPPKKPSSPPPDADEHSSTTAREHHPDADEHSSTTAREHHPDADDHSSTTVREHHPTTRHPNASTPTPPHKPHPSRDPTATDYTYYDDFPPQDSNNGTQHPHDDSVANRKCRCDYVCQKFSPLDAKRVIIPLPVLDDCCAPQSIAVPFRKRPLRNLCSRNSAFILEYYYIAVIKCFIAKGNTRTDIKNFNSQFHAWLLSQVFPHLKDEKWYPAFGGVLRVMETIRKFGAETTAKDSALHDIAYMFDKGVQFDAMEVPGMEKVRNVKEADDCCTIPKRRYLIAILVVSLITVFIFCTCAFYCQATRGSYLLYEGHSEASTYSRARRSAYKKKEKFINFHFLVKFFNQKQDLPSPNAEEVQCFATIEKQTNVWKSLPHAVKPRSPEDTHQCKEQTKKDLSPGGEAQEGKSKEKRRLTLVGEGSVPSYMVCRAGEPHPPHHGWDCKMATRRDETEQEEQETDMEEEPDEVHMLWRKPSVRFKKNATLRGDERKPKGRFERSSRSTPTTTTGTTGTTSDDFFSKSSSNSCSASLEDESKDSSTEKGSSTDCCSESCQHSSTTSISSYSQNQVEEKLSSATMQFFERVIARHKLRRKGPSQESTAESDSEVDDSYSSESNY